MVSPALLPQTRWCVQTGDMREGRKEQICLLAALLQLLPLFLVLLSFPVFYGPPQRRALFLL